MFPTKSKRILGKASRPHSQTLCDGTCFPGLTLIPIAESARSAFRSIYRKSEFWFSLDFHFLKMEKTSPQTGSFTVVRASWNYESDGRHRDSGGLQLALKPNFQYARNFV